MTRNGVDSVTVKELLGHSSLTVTMRYAHTDEETKTAAVKKIKAIDKAATLQAVTPT